MVCGGGVQQRWTTRSVGAFPAPGRVGRLAVSVISHLQGSATRGQSCKVLLCTEDSQQSALLPENTRGIVVYGVRSTWYEYLSMRSDAANRQSIWPRHWPLLPAKRAMAVSVAWSDPFALFFLAFALPPESQARSSSLP